MSQILTCELEKIIHNEAKQMQSTPIFVPLCWTQFLLHKGTKVWSQTGGLPHIPQLAYVQIILASQIKAVFDPLIP